MANSKASFCQKSNSNSFFLSISLIPTLIIFLILGLSGIKLTNFKKEYIFLAYDTFPSNSAILILPSTIIDKVLSKLLFPVCSAINPFLISLRFLLIF